MPSRTGWMLVDTNGDGIADFVNGKVVVPARPSAAENAAAANLAARLGFGTTGLTLPMVINAGANASTNAVDAPRIWVGKDAVPAQFTAELATLAPKLGCRRGRRVCAERQFAIVANDDRGLGAAADAYTARAPYQWKVPGEKLEAIATAVGSSTQLVGVTYKRGDRRRVSRDPAKSDAGDHCRVKRRVRIESA